MNKNAMRTTSVAPSGLMLANPDAMHDPASMAYSHLAIVPPGASLVFVAGQTGGADKGSYREQAREALRSVRTAMRAAGGEMVDVAKLTVYSVGHDVAKHADLVSEVKDAFDSGLAPTCTIVPLDRSGTDERQLIEIEAIGVLAPREAGR